jgi:GDP-4-dehydro-6-deoxy-D-mannose reductase
VIHLAAVTQLPKQGDHHLMYEINVQGTLNILDSLIKQGLACPFLLVGSGAQYGPPLPEEVPIRETNVCRPITHYAVTKAMQDLLGYSFWRQGIPVIRTRAFNILGPRQSPTFVSSSIARQIAEIELGRKDPLIDVGNTNTERDFIDVRDVVRAYMLALEEGRPGEAYNIGSGRATSIRYVIEILLSLSHRRGIVIQQDLARVREVDVPTQVADCSKLKKQTGWEPEISLEQSLGDMLDYWRVKLQGMPE